MLKYLLVCALSVVAISEQASAVQPLIQISEMVSASPNQDWKPGDTANYNLKVGTFLNGTMKMMVKAYDENGLLLLQEMDLKVMQQSCEILLDPGTGEIKKMVCNGQSQDPGEQDVEILDMQTLTVTVPAGTFDCTWVKARENNSGNISEQWVNPNQIPVLGMIKMVTDSQMGKVVAELTSFIKK